MLLLVTLMSLFWLIFFLYKFLVINPKNLQIILRKQGINGPKPFFLFGNLLEIKKICKATAKSTTIIEDLDSHNYGEALFPFLDQWKKQYGDVFMFSFGNNTQIVHVTQQEMVREITTCTSLDLGKPTYQAEVLGSLLGNGIIVSNGTFWAHQRKILAPELYMDKVKGMIKIIQESSLTLVSSWNNEIESQGGIYVDIKIDEDMRSFSGDVISKACFGSNFYKGKDIFLKLRALQEDASKRSISKGIPGIRYVPTKNNRETWRLVKEIKKSILKIVKEREEAGSEKDLLQMLLEEARNSDLSQDEINSFIVDNCKNIYQAGYETTAVAATWCLMLLAANPNWQDRIRAEVAHICQGQIPNVDTIGKMKQLTMVIYEALRLYPPVSIISREALKDMNFGGINFPKGINIWTNVITLHTNPKIWGNDSYKFNPKRFSNGIKNSCKFPHVYMPFGVGPRICLGQNLAMVELKIIISLILINFSLSISPKYIHSPTLNLVIEPRYGVYLSVKKL